MLREIFIWETSQIHCYFQDAVIFQPLGIPTTPVRVDFNIGVPFHHRSAAKMWLILYMFVFNSWPGENQNCIWFFWEFCIFQNLDYLWLRVCETSLLGYFKCFLTRTNDPTWKKLLLKFQLGNVATFLSAAWMMSMMMVIVKIIFCHYWKGLYDFGWIFGKLPNGRGGGSFPIERISLQFSYSESSLTLFNLPIISRPKFWSFPFFYFLPWPALEPELALTKDWLEIGNIWEKCHPGWIKSRKMQNVKKLFPDTFCTQGTLSLICFNLGLMLDQVLSLWKLYCPDNPPCDSKCFPFFPIQTYKRTVVQKIK